MRAALLLAFLVPLALLVAYLIAHKALLQRLNRKHITELEESNQRLDDLIHPPTRWEDKNPSHVTRARGGRK